MSAAAEFLSEPITPCKGRFDAPAMARGEPGLPSGFQLRGVSYNVIQRIEQWKHSERKSGRARGELYLRRHFFKLRMSDGSIWTVYFVRQPLTSGSVTDRWFLYTVQRDVDDP